MYSISWCCSWSDHVHIKVLSNSSEGTVWFYIIKKGCKADGGQPEEKSPEFDHQFMNSIISCLFL